MMNVVSTRVRFARNVAGYPFKGRMSEGLTADLLRKIKDVSGKVLPEFSWLDMDNIDDLRTGSLVEHHIISPDFAENRTGEALLLNKDSTVSVMVNEEDHLRIQAILPGYDLKGAFDLAVKTETALDSLLHFSYNDELGYITRCPTNLGTAMRVSVLIHLPALTESGEISRLSSSLTQYGLTIRGIYGEGSKAGGALYQISNEITLGYSEEEIIDRISEIVDRICKVEKQTCNKLTSRIQIQDRIYRSLGTLSFARTMSSAECMTCLSDVRFGSEAGLLDIPFSVLDRLNGDIQPYSMELAGDGNRDIRRAELVRNTIAAAKGGTK